MLAKDIVLKLDVTIASPMGTVSPIDLPQAFDSENAANSREYWYSKTYCGITKREVARPSIYKDRGTMIRAEATLVDGRRVDDAAVIDEVLSEEVDVNLVDLQALVTSRDGRPLSGLVKDYFVIFQDKQEQVIDRFYRADDVALSIALLVGSSGSMASIWPRKVEVSRLFLSQVLEALTECIHIFIRAAP